MTQNTTNLDHFLEPDAPGPPPTTLQVLSRADRESPTWLKLKAHLETKLQSLREKNDVLLDEAHTARLRGRIAQVKECLALGDDPLSAS